MLRTNDNRQTVHVNPAEPQSSKIPSRREVMDSFERILGEIEMVNGGDLYVDLYGDIEVLRIYLATR